MNSVALTQPTQTVEEFEAAEAGFRKRSALLKMRMSFIGVSGLFGWIVALVSLPIFSNSLMEEIVRARVGIDIPQGLFSSPASPAYGLAFLFAFAMAGLIGIANDVKRGMRRGHVVVWVLAMSLFGSGALYSHSRMLARALTIAGEPLEAQQLADAAKKGDLSKAIALLPMQSHLLESQYVLAQIALRHGDQKALEIYAKPLLDELDRQLLRMNPGSQYATVVLPGLRVDVLQRLDRELYSVPHSQVSLGELAESLSAAPAGSSGTATRWWMTDAARLVAALLLAALSAGALLLFHRMAQRSLRLRAWLGME